MIANPHAREAYDLVRMSQGKMMGVDFNIDKTWVGAGVALHETAKMLRSRRDAVDISSDRPFDDHDIKPAAIEAVFSYTPTSRKPCFRQSARLASLNGKM